MIRPERRYLRWAASSARCMEMQVALALYAERDPADPCIPTGQGGAMGDEQGDDARQGIGGALTPTEVQAFLESGRLCRLGWLRDDGWPAVVPVWYEWDGQGFFLVP